MTEETSRERELRKRLEATQESIRMHRLAYKDFDKQLRELDDEIDKCLNGGKDSLSEPTNYASWTKKSTGV